MFVVWVEGAKFFALFRARHARYGVLVDVEELLAIRREGDPLPWGVLIDVGAVHCLSQRGEVSCFFEAFDRGLTFRGQVYVPAGKCAQYDAYDAGDDGEHYIVYGHHGVNVGGVGKYFFPHPRRGRSEAVEGENCGVD